MLFLKSVCSRELEVKLAKDRREKEELEKWPGLSEECANLVAG